MGNLALLLHSDLYLLTSVDTALSLIKTMLVHSAQLLLIAKNDESGTSQMSFFLMNDEADVNKDVGTNMNACIK